MEVEMDITSTAVEMVFDHILGGLGLFFTGIGVLWIGSILAKRYKG
jgi:hypothetical protein